MRPQTLHDYKALAKGRRRIRPVAALITGMLVSTSVAAAAAATNWVTRQPWPSEAAWIAILLVWGAGLTIGCAICDWFYARREVFRG